MSDELKKNLEESPLIIALKNEKDLSRVLKLESKIIFLLCGDILSIEELTRQIKSSGKKNFVHIDMIEGLDSRAEKSIDFLKNNSYADGIISTKPSMIKYAKKNGFITIQRCFLIDSLSFGNTKKILKEGNADAIEILPGGMPKIIKKISSMINVPLIAGGLIMDLEDIEIRLKNGALGVSTTDLKVAESYCEINKKNKL
ncbi:MAG: glycerol-3-phosphate responsive antiterminator [Fusobacteriaceae bacterium]